MLLALSALASAVHARSLMPQLTRISSRRCVFAVRASDRDCESSSARSWNTAELERSMTVREGSLVESCVYVCVCVCMYVCMLNWRGP